MGDLVSVAILDYTWYSKRILVDCIKDVLYVDIDIHKDILWEDGEPKVKIGGLTFVLFYLDLSNDLPNRSALGVESGINDIYNRYERYEVRTRTDIGYLVSTKKVCVEDISTAKDEGKIELSFLQPEKDHD